MNVKGFKDKVFTYVFENEKGGYLFFDGEVAAKVLEIPDDLVMDIMHEFEDQGFFTMLGMAQLKNQVRITMHGYEVYEKFKAEINNTDKSTTPVDSIDIFISHSAKDENLAQALINLLVKAFHLKSKQIRCTSIPAYKLDIGVDTATALKAQIFSSKIFIGLLTEHSLNSTYVLFELGARWSTDKPLLPLICDPKGASLLESPLNNINALVATNEAELHKFVENVGTYLGIEADSAASYSNELKQLNKLSFAENSSTQHSVSSTTVNNDEYSNAMDIIKKRSVKEYPDDYDMQVYVIEKEVAALEELKKGRPSDIPEDVFNKIRAGAKQRYPDEYDMQLYIEQNQYQAYRKLNN